MKILFVQTGGTIDKDYPKTTKGWGFEIGDPAFSRLLEERLSPSFEYETLTVCQKDSMEITDTDRIAMVREIDDLVEETAIAEAFSFAVKAFEGVVITHGTDTMAETARFIAKSNQNRYVPIILTGSMRPERFSNSDADCNLGMAIAAVQTSPPGFVGVCMHGLVLPHDQIDRDQKTGKFYRRRIVKKENSSKTLILTPRSKLKVTKLPSSLPSLETMSLSSDETKSTGPPTISNDKKIKGISA